MNNLQNEIYTHVAIYNDGKKDFLTGKEYADIYNDSANESDGIWLKGKYIRFSNIARIIEVSEYQEKYRNEMPASIPQFPYENILPKEKYNRIKALKSIIAGFKRTNSNPENSLLNKMEATLKEAELAIQ